METGTQIILQRMIDCPEEFPSGVEYHGKWTKIISEARNILPTEDVEALDTAHKQLLIDRYNERVLKTLAGENDEIFKGRVVEKQYYGGAIAKQEGAMVGTLQEREAQIQRDMRAAQNSSAYPTAGLQNSMLGGWWTK
jgi:hypothetical protein